MTAEPALATVPVFRPTDTTDRHRRAALTAAVAGFFVVTLDAVVVKPTPDT